MLCINRMIIKLDNDNRMIIKLAERNIITSVTQMTPPLRQKVKKN